MNAQEKFDRIVERYSHPHQSFFARPHLSRRHFFQLAGAGVTASFLNGRLGAQELAAQTPVTTINTAKNVIFILLAGAPSHTDTFDLKEISGTTPVNFAPETISGLRWPTGLFPKLAARLPDIAIVRSARSWNLQHTLAQTWLQIGRNPTAALGDIAPNIGSIVSIEKAPERKPTQVFPSFLGLNSSGAIGSGYLSASFAPFRIAPSTAGLPNVANSDGATRFEDKWNTLQALDGELRANSPLGKDVESFDLFYRAARGLMYNPVVDQAFKFTAPESARYGSNAFGNACLVAKQVLAADQGTRFIQITLGGWDMHSDIYGAQNPRGNNLYTLGKQLDDGLSELLGDLKSSGLLNETLIVMQGEFGRTVGKVTAQGGRDHYLQQFCLFAGAGVRGGRTIGSTDSTGARTTEYGWSRERDIKPEDIEATIYSAMGINWTNVRYDDPFHRGFYLVPSSDQDLYGPINELWA